MLGQHYIKLGYLAAIKQCKVYTLNLEPRGHMSFSGLIIGKGQDIPSVILVLSGCHKTM